MGRFLCVAATLCLLALPAASADYRVDVITDQLELPWSVASLPNGDLLVTERIGQLKRITAEGEQTPIEGVPEVYFAKQAGLFEVLLDPAFETNQQIYLSYAAGTAEDNQTTVARARLNGDMLEDLTVILAVSPGKDTAHHFGGKLAFLPDGTLLLSVGEGFRYMDKAQQLDNELGKLLRFNADGTAPTDNPFPDVAPRVYSYGHRNPQGLAIDPVSGDLFMIEHGPKGGDELNRIAPGNNYGWPAITYGVGYDDAIISEYTEAEGMEQPLRYWVPSIAPSGLAFYDGALFSDWRGDALIGALRDRKLYRLTFENGAVVQQSEPFPEVTGRVRDVRVDDSGVIYAVTDEGTLYRVTR